MHEIPSPIRYPPPENLLPHHFCHRHRRNSIRPAAPHIITMQIRLACGKARVKSPTLFTSYPASPTLVFISLPRNAGSLFHLPTPTSCPLSTRDSTSHQLPSHICKTCHYYNNITPMNLPLNMRSAIVDCIANYLPGGVIRTGLSRDRDFKRNARYVLLRIRTFHLLSSFYPLFYYLRVTVISFFFFLLVA